MTRIHARYFFFPTKYYDDECICTIVNDTLREKKKRSNWRNFLTRRYGMRKKKNAHRRRSFFASNILNIEWQVLKLMYRVFVSNKRAPYLSGKGSYFIHNIRKDNRIKAAFLRYTCRYTLERFLTTNTTEYIRVYLTKTDQTPRTRVFTY